MTGPDIRTAECQFGENRYSVIWAISPIWQASGMSAEIRKGFTSSIGSVTSNPKFYRKFQSKIIWLHPEPHLALSPQTCSSSSFPHFSSIENMAQVWVMGVTKDEIQRPELST